MPLDPLYLAAGLGALCLLLAVVTLSLQRRLSLQLTRTKRRSGGPELDLRMVGAPTSTVIINVRFDGSQAKVMIQARNQVEAKKLLQAQYAGCRVIWGPVQGRW